MAQGLDERTGSDQLTGLRAALDALCDQPTGLLAGGEQLDAAEGRRSRLEAQLHTWLALQAARIDAGEIAWQEHGTSTATWLADAANLTRREAGRLITAGQGLVRFPLVADAAATGRCCRHRPKRSPRCWTTCLTTSPPTPSGKHSNCWSGSPRSHNSVELRRLTSHLVEILITGHRRSPRSRPARPRTPPGRTHPASDVQLRPPRLRPDQRFAAGRRSRTVHPDHRRLRRGDQKRGLERLDPHTEYVTPAMRRADALLAMVHHHSQESLAPNHGGDRPRIVITLPYDKLLADCRGAAAAQHRRPDRRRHRPPPAVRRRPHARHPRRTLRGARRRADPAPGHPRHPRSPRTPRRWLCVPRLRHTSPRQRSPPHHPLATRRPYRPVEPRPALRPPPRHRRTQPPTPHADRWKVRLRTDGTPEILPPLRVDPSQKTTTPRTLPHATHTGRRSVIPATSSPTKGRAASYSARPYRRSPASPRPGTM